MTFLTTRYRLSKPLTSKELESLSRVSTVYSILGVAIEGSVLKIEYDASRIHEAEVLAAVRRVGISVQPEKPIPFGAFDYTGAFKDFAWPTSGVSPINQQAK